MSMRTLEAGVGYCCEEFKNRVDYIEDKSKR